MQLVTENIRRSEVFIKVTEQVSSMVVFSLTSMQLDIFVQLEVPIPFLAIRFYALA